MNIRDLSAVLMAAGLIIATPAFAQTSSAQKQKTQEGEVTTTGIQHNPNYRQPAQEGDAANPWQLADPKYKQKTQEGEVTTTGIQHDPKFKQPAQEGDAANPWQLADPKYKQHTQNLTHSEPTGVVGSTK